MIKKILRKYRLCRHDRKTNVIGWGAVMELNDTWCNCIFPNFLSRPQWFRAAYLKTKGTVSWFFPVFVIREFCRCFYITQSYVSCGHGTRDVLIRFRRAWTVAVDNNGMSYFKNGRWLSVEGRLFDIIVDPQ